jgi:Ca-activated chloride channel family protein
MKKLFLTVLTAIFLISISPLFAAGTLKPLETPEAPIQILDHHVNIVINNGFAHTEVIQTFFNPNDQDLEAIYSFPLPKSASLSEMTIYIGEMEINGEVIEKEKARKIYEQERDQGNDAGLAEKKEFYSYEFYVSPVHAQDETRIHFVYYQPLEIDTGVGRYIYPLEEGGTDDVGASFWLSNSRVEGTFSVDLELKSAFPVVDVRMPGFEGAAVVDQLGEGHYKVKVEISSDASLDRDFIFYYRLQENLPGRVELIPYRADKDKPGTFMMVVTPGLDLQPITNGADYVFILDVSGSMQGKIQTLAHGIVKALGELDADDRYRIVTFNKSAHKLTKDWVVATQDNARSSIGKVEKLRASGSTNLYAGLNLGLKDLDDDRATSIILVTDAVTNTGVVDPKEFHKLMKNYDVRVFGFLMGNSANWPLMRTIAEASGGFYASVSNSDDIIGQILLAKSKITFECLHDAALKITGVKVFDATDEIIGKVYRGQQLVIFGRYAEGGRANVTMKARMTGQDKTYSTSFDFPSIDTENPEVERLWAMNRIEEIENLQNAGIMPTGEAEDAIKNLGLEYQLVTDYTSMVVLPDEVFDHYGIDRKNKMRVETERQAQAIRTNQPPKSRQVDQEKKMFDFPSPDLGIGAFDPITALIALALGLLPLLGFRRNSSGKRK